jgi:hypothetical protein
MDQPKDIATSLLRKLADRFDRTNGRADSQAMTTSAIEQIVDAYVRLKNIQALEDLRMHRQRLVRDLKGTTGYDVRFPMNQMEQDIAVIEAGLAKLRP